jgi:hypothetical protein
MNNVSVQWLTQDESLFEVDWLRYLVSDVAEYINVESNADKVETNSNTLLICNHAVPYRVVLDKLRQNGKKYAVVLLSDENLREPCEWLHDPNCVGLLRNYVHPNQINHPKVTVFGLGYKRGFKEHCNMYGENREFKWCFAGTPHGDRLSALNLFKNIQPHQKHLCSGFGAKDGLSTQDYVTMLNNSIFALTPEGQDSMDSFRLYEALEAGCIPITKLESKQFTIRPSYWHAVFYGENNIPFIFKETWEECLNAVQDYSEKDIKTKQKECVIFWNRWKTIWKNKFTEVYNSLIYN